MKIWVLIIVISFWLLVGVLSLISTIRLHYDLKGKSEEKKKK